MVVEVSKVAICGNKIMGNRYGTIKIMYVSYIPLSERILCMTKYEV